MNLQDLVQAVARKDFYLQFKSPRDQRILDVLGQVDRKKFIPDYEDKSILTDPTISIQLGAATLQLQYSSEIYTTNLQEVAYNDIALPIGHDQTCSQPSMVAFMCDVLDLKPGMRILEIGTGCGYHAAVTSELVGENGHVVSVERIPPLADFAWKNLRHHFGESMGQRLTLITGDGSLGVQTAGNFDRIYFTAAVCREKFDPTVFASHLSSDGILLYPETKGSLVREEYNFEIVQDTKFYAPVCFVPMYGANGGNEEKK